MFIDSPVIPGGQWAKGAESTLTYHSSHDCKKISEHLLVLEWHACSYIDVCASKFPSRSRIYQEAVEFAEQKLSTFVQLMINTVTQDLVLLTSVCAIITTKIVTMPLSLVDRESVLTGRIAGSVHRQEVNGEGATFDEMSPAARID